MSKVKVLIVLSAIIFGLGAASCRTKHTCPAYGKALSSQKHRV